MRSKALLLSCLLASAVNGDFDACTFEEDECGWFSGSSVGVGGWRRVTTQELEDEHMDVHPSQDAAEAKTGEKSQHILTILQFFAKSFSRSLHVCSLQSRFEYLCTHFS